MKLATRDAFGATFAPVRSAAHFESRSARGPYFSTAASSPPCSWMTARTMQWARTESRFHDGFLTISVTWRALPGQLRPVNGCQAGCSSSPSSSSSSVKNTSSASALLPRLLLRSI